MVAVVYDPVNIPIQECHISANPVLLVRVQPSANPVCLFVTVERMQVT
jgi:hypothetical protein